VPSVTTPTSIIRIYYGNPSAGSSSEGDGTFEFFDDFGTPGLNTSKWTVEEGSSYSILNSKLRIGGGDIAIVSKKKWNQYIYEGEIQITTPNYPGLIYNAYQSGYYYDIYWSSGEMWLHTGSIWKRSRSIDLSWIPDTSLHEFELKVNRNSVNYGFYKNGILQKTADFNLDSAYNNGGVGFINYFNGAEAYYDNIRVRKYASSEPTITLAPPKSSSLSITKSASPYSLRQFQESTIKVLIENSGTSEVKAIEIMDSIHPSFDLTGGDFPNPKKYDSIRAGESRELQYTIKSKESGAFTLDPASVTYADSEGNIQEVKSEAVSIKVVPSTEGGSSGASSGQPSGQSSRSASVSLTGEKTDVVLGEDILLKLSAVNLITKPKMHVQVIIIPPSGMSVTSTEFSKSGTNQFTANYELDPGDGKDIEVKIKPNQIGDFNVNGRIIYYFGDEKEKAEDHTLPLPIKVRKEPGQTAPVGSADVPAKAPGFGGGIAIIGILFIAIYIRKRF
jgi:hypothetical protein